VVDFTTSEISEQCLIPSLTNPLLQAKMRPCGWFYQRHIQTAVLACTMFENLTERLSDVFDKLRRRGKLSERDVDAAMREIRLALLEADVNYKVVKEFIPRVRERSVGHEVSRALNPGQQVIKIVNEELIATLGEPERLILKGQKPRIIMLVGLQGSGKTTTAAKLARLLKQQGERVLMVAADPYRPAAAQQLQTLGDQLDISVYVDDGRAPAKLTGNAVKTAKSGGYSVVILDTAGRSQLDADLMTELTNIAGSTDPSEVLLVVDAMIGQESVNIAEGFRKSVAITGLVLNRCTHKISWNWREIRCSRSL
jgi:signal recognition particle subunit SRP54